MEGHGREAEERHADELPHCLQGRDDGELVRRTGYRAGQRRGSGRCQRAWRLPRGTEEDEPVVPARLGLCPAPARRPRHHTVERLHHRDTEELDRPFRRYGGGVHQRHARGRQGAQG